MHIQEGLISMSYPLILSIVLAVIILAIIFYLSRDTLEEKNIPMIALLTVVAVIVQLIELPLPVAACVHVSLITFITLYDFKTSVIVYTFVTIIQALFIHEGGVTTLGLNLINLAILAPIFSEVLYKLFAKINKYLAIAIASFGTIFLLGIVAAIEYTIAGVFTLDAAFITIIPVEALVGVLEAVVTLVLMKALLKVKPELVPVLANN